MGGEEVTRRGLLGLCALAFAAPRTVSEAQNSRQQGAPQLPPITQPAGGQQPSIPGFPPMPVEPPEPGPPKMDPDAILKHNQDEIRKEIARLYDLVGKLKRQIEKSEPSKVLSLSAVDETRQIEKLAKHIRGLLLPSGPISPAPGQLH